jgi:hypothetical protein
MTRSPTTSNTTFCITTPDDVQFYRADSGVFAGSSLGTDLFNISAWPAQTAWCEERRRLGVARHLEMIHPFDDSIVNPAVTIFADDAGSIVTADSIEQLALHDARDDRTFDETHAKIGLRQNADKAIRQIRLQGIGAAAIYRTMHNNKT